MRKRKTIKLDDREITVKELTVKEILEIGDNITSQDSKKDSTELTTVKDTVGKHLHLGIEGIVIDDLIEMAPSEIDTIYRAFKEVNGVFFEVAQQVGLTQILQSMKDQLRTDFLRSLAA